MTAAISMTERARQDGYDAGYVDGQDVGAIDALGPDVVSFRRPPWMSAERWQRISVAMTEFWLTLLDEAAREAAR